MAVDKSEANTSGETAVKKKKLVVVEWRELRQNIKELEQYASQDCSCEKYKKEDYEQEDCPRCAAIEVLYYLESESEQGVYDIEELEYDQ